MSSKPTPHNLELVGPQYSPVETLPLDGCTWELVAGSTRLTGLGGAASVQIPVDATSVLIESMAAEVRFRGGTDNAVTVALPSADVMNGTAGGWLPSLAAATYRFADANGKPSVSFLALLSSGGVRLTWFN